MSTIGFPQEHKDGQWKWFKAGSATNLQESFRNCQPRFQAWAGAQFEQGNELLLDALATPACQVIDLPGAIFMHEVLSLPTTELKRKPAVCAFAAA